MRLFTFIMEFRGGTYINQVEADSLEDAILLWPASLTIQEIKHFGEKSREALKLKLADADETPILLDGLTNCWCHAFSLPTGFALVNIVQTDPSRIG